MNRTPVIFLFYDFRHLAATILLVLTLGGASGSAAGARVWHVPGDAPSIAAGIDSAASGDTVLVACGTYLEHNLPMKSGVCLRSETGTPDCVTIDAQRQGRVFSLAGVDSTATIVGFTITGGRAGSGGGMHCSSASAALVSCTFYNNWADDAGGGLYCAHAGPSLTACVFSGNSASHDVRWDRSLALHRHPHRLCAHGELGRLDRWRNQLLLLHSDCGQLHLPGKSRQ